MEQEQNKSINISIGSGQQLREGSSINISNIGNTTVGTGEQQPNTATMPDLEKEPPMPPTNEDSFDEIAPLREEIKLKKRRLQAQRWPLPQVPKRSRPRSYSNKAFPASATRLS